MREPLYQLIHDGVRPDIQKLDSKTITWLGKNLNPKVVSIKKLVPDWQPIPWNVISIFIPKKSYYLNKKISSSIHGITHATRVVIFAAILSQCQLKKQVPGLLLAAGNHDIRRTCDVGDPGHNERACDWILNSELPFGMSVRKKAVSILHAQEKSKRGIEANIVVDADAIDRFRLPSPRWWPKKEFMTQDGIRLLGFAKYFIWSSEKRALKMNPVQAVKRTAIEVGILRS